MIRNIIEIGAQQCRCFSQFSFKMKLSCRSVFFIVFVSLAAFFTLRLKKSISTEVDQRPMFDDNESAFNRLSNSTDSLMWFVQISDLHVSIFQDKERIVELREFCDLTLKVIKPPVVLATGDLTDAKTDDRMGSNQMIEEWTIYSDILTKCQISKTTTWLDIRGNHDNFNVPGILSPNNLYRKYSAQGPLHDKSYLHVQQVGNKNYSFIGVDACPDQGMKRPLNFVGYLTFDELLHLRSLERIAAQSSDYTVWFGHYPTSCMVNSPGLRGIIGTSNRSLVYLCGHFHTLLNFVPRMYTIQKEHYLELELADWKENRMFRIAAIDHGIFSFVDLKHRDWPAILVTNPKNALYRLRLKESVSILNSTHVRILVFSPNEVASVKFKIDDSGWKTCKRHREMNNLFLREWNPKQYIKGLHRIQVVVADQLGHEKTVDHLFTLDESHSEFDLLPRLILMLSFPSVLQFLFTCSAATCVLPLLSSRFLGRCKYDPLAIFMMSYCRNWSRRIWFLSNSGWIFKLLVAYPFYVAVGPWAVGEVMDNHYGIIFIWGTYVNGEFVHELSTYAHGYIQLTLFHFPLIICTAYSLDHRRLTLETALRSMLSSFINSLLCTGTFITILLCNSWMAFSFWSAYGISAVALNPVRIWPVVMTIGLWYYSRNFPVSKMRILSARWKQIIKNYE